MKTFVDFHIHSKYSRATSKSLDLQEIAKWAQIKGLDVVSCGDFTHPKWFSELRSQLTEDGSGLLSLPEQGSIRFILGTEVACIYRHGSATRRLHHLILAPSLDAAERINKGLTARGCKLGSDGRPILGMSSKELLELVLVADPKAALIPAHIWTPWFAIFGSKSGYNSVEECFEDLSQYIFALETGLSSDPQMNWAWSALDRYALVSNSDAHSGPKIGREANVFNIESRTYDALLNALKYRDGGFLSTIEFFPEEGMYHYDGHRACSMRLDPTETKKCKGLCPVCKRPVTVGVLHRVDNLRDREFGFQPPAALPFAKIVPLPEIIADYLFVSESSKKVRDLYFEIISRGGTEFRVLLDLDEAELLAIMPHGLAEAIVRMRNGEVSLNPGYDGNYGNVSLFSERLHMPVRQQTLL